MHIVILTLTIHRTGLSELRPEASTFSVLNHLTRSPNIIKPERDVLVRTCRNGAFELGWTALINSDSVNECSTNATTCETSESPNVTCNLVVGLELIEVIRTQLTGAL